MMLRCFLEVEAHFIPSLAAKSHGSGLDILVVLNSASSTRGMFLIALIRVAS